jgi:hypothetical protein
MFLHETLMPFRHLLSLLFTLFVLIAMPAAGVTPIAPPSFGPMPSISWRYSVAEYDGSALAMWRVGPNAFWGVALNAEGQPVGTARPLLIDPSGSAQMGPLAAGAPGFAFVWSDGYSRGHLALLDAAGNVTLRRSGNYPRFALLLWSGELLHGFELGSDHLIRVHTFDEQLEPVGTTTLPPVGAVYQLHAERLDDGSIVLVSTGWSGVHLQRLTADGKVLGSPLLIEPSAGSSTAYRPLSASLATDGSAAMIVWSAGAHNEKPDLKSVIVQRDDTMVARRTIVAGRWDTMGGAVAWSDGHYTVFITIGERQGDVEERNIYGYRLDASGEPIDTGFIPLLVRPGLQGKVSILTFGRKPLIFFTEGTYGRETIYNRVVDPSAWLPGADPASVDAIVSTAAAWQLSTVVAAGGDEWRAVWIEQTAARVELRTAALGRDGRQTGPISVIATQPLYLSSPSLSFNGVDFIVTWREGLAALVRRASRHGELLGETALIAPDIRGLSVASNPGVTLFVWSSGGAIHSRWMDTTGSFSPPVMISPAPFELEDRTAITYDDPRVAADGERFVVSWSRVERPLCLFPACPEKAEAMARLLDRYGTPAGEPLLLDGASSVTQIAATREGALLLSGRHAWLLDRSTGSATPLGDLFSGHDLFSTAVVVEGGRYLVTASSRISPHNLARRVTSSGTVEALRPFTSTLLPRAVNASGQLLGYGSLALPDAPRHGAPTAVVELIDLDRYTAAPRRRGVRPGPAASSPTMLLQPQRGVESADAGS